MTDPDYELVRNIHSALRKNQETSDGLHFKSERETPGFFWLNGRPKTALTGHKPGDAIFVNLDQLYSLDETGALRPVTVLESTTLLLHELAHHQGIGNSDAELRQLDVMTAKVAHFLKRPKVTLPNAISVWKAGGSAVDILLCRSLDPRSPYDSARVRVRSFDSGMIYSMVLDRASPPPGRSTETPVRFYMNGTSLEIMERRTFDVPIRLSLSLTPERDPSEDPFVKLLPLSQSSATMTFRYAARLREKEVYAWECSLSESVLKLQSPLSAFFAR